MEINKRKKVIFTVINDLSYDRRMDRICTSLSQNNFEVVLVGRMLPNSKPLTEKIYRQKRLKCFFHKGAKFYLEYNIRLFFYLLFTKVNIYGAIDLDTIIPNKWVAQIKSKILVYDAHEYFTEVIEIQHKPFVKNVWKWIEGYSLDPNTKAYTVSASIAKEFKKQYGTDFELIKNCPPIKEKLIFEKYPRFTFVYVGAVNEGRGIEESIKAINGLNADLRVCGDGDVLEKLKMDLPEHQKDQVTFTGYMTPDDLEAEIAKSHVGLLLIKAESLSYYFSLANKFFDYIHAEVPQIVSDYPEYTQMNTEFEVALLCPMSVEEIRNKMQTLMNESILYEHLVENTKKAKLEWNWQKEEVKLIQFYNRLV